MHSSAVLRPVRDGPPMTNAPLSARSTPKVVRSSPPTPTMAHSGDFGRTGFACSCAERLVPLYELFATAAGQGDRSTLRRALDLAWTATAAREIANDQREAVEALVPHEDDDDWSQWSAFAQNAAAAVAYALRTLLSGDSQNGVWAARQLYEAADFVVRASTPGPNYAEGGEAVAVALAAIASALEAAGSADPDELRAAAVADGSVLRRLAEDITAA